MLKNAVCLLQPFGDKYLSISRRHNPFKMGLVGGKVDGDETLEEALVRETLEETGMILDPTKLTKLYTGICDGEQVFLVTTFLGVYKDTKDISRLTPEEGMIISLLTEEQLCDPSISPFAEYNVLVFEQLKNI